MSGTIYCFDPRNNGHCYTAETRPDLVYGRSLSGAEEDAAMLATVVADAQATQSIHKEMIQRMADWEAREPGRLVADEELRNAFISNFDGLRAAFTDRNLQKVGVMFPMQLDRASPAHAVLIAVRDDIADTRDRVQANQAQYVLSKQIAEVRIGLAETLARQAAQTAADAAEALRRGAGAGAEGVKDFAKTLAWVLGGGFVLYLITQRGGGK